MSERPPDKDYAFKKVPVTARMGFVPMFFIMLGFTFFSASMSVGAALGNGLDFRTFCSAVITGGLILSVYTGVLAYIGCATGLSFDLLAQRAFGSQGGLIPSFLIALTQSGWFGVGVAMFATAASEVIGCNRWVLIMLAGICMMTSAYHGIKGMEIVSYISVPLIIVLGVYSILKALGEGGSIVEIFAENTDRLTLMESIGLVIGSFISGGTSTPNFTRFAKGRRAAVISTVIAFFIGNSLMFAFGAVGGAFTGKEDIFYVMIAQGLTVPALIVLGANIWTTNDNALYTGALGLSSITKIPKRPMVLAAGIFGTLASVWLYEHFVTWLTLLNAVLPPIGAVLMMDFFFCRSRYIGDDSEKHIVRFNFPNSAGIIVGAAIGIGVSAQGLTTLYSMASACLCYILFNFRKIFGNNACKDEKSNV